MVIKGVRKVLTADMRTVPFFDDSRRVVVSIVLAILILVGINAELERVNMNARGGSKVRATSSSVQIPADPPVEGAIQGTGTHFAVTESEYLNVGLDSADPIEASIESVPQMVLVKVKTGSAAIVSTSLTISGLLPLTTYHRYEDDYTVHEEFTTDESGKYVFVQDLSEPHLIYIQPRPSTKIIKSYGGGDCSSVGTWNDAAKTCTLTTNVNESIQIDGNNIVLDGNGYTVSGSNTGFGVYLSAAKTGVVVKNLTVSNFTYGMYLNETNGNTIQNNTLTGNVVALRLDGASSNTIISNTITNNNNGINLTSSSMGGSTNNTIRENKVSFSSVIGINVYTSSNNNLVVNNDVSNNYWGVYVRFSSYNTVDGNSILNNGTGISIGYATATNNKVLNNTVKFDKNNISIRLHDSTTGNLIYNNYFSDPPYFNGTTPFNNSWNIDKTSGTNIAGGSYIGGNFWANSAGTGFSEKCADSDADGICNSNYVMDPNNTDYLPLARPDATPPHTTISLSGTMGDNSWYVSDVTITLNAADNNSGSGIAKTEYSFDNASWNAYSSSFVSGIEGTSMIYYRSIDNAGNVEQVKSQSFKIDKTGPIVAGTIVNVPNANNWHKENVVVKFSCSDAISGAVTPAFDVTVNTEGSNQQAFGQCTDNAGNNSSFSVGGINIDKTSPVVSVLRSPDPNSRGWNNTPVTVTFAASDSLSDIDGSSASIITFGQEGAGQSANQNFADKAGNIAQASASGINIDLTRPVITGAATVQPNINGWYNSDVTVHFNANDTLSGLASAPQDVILTASGANQEATGTAEDYAGNQAIYKVSGISIDRTPPTISGAALTSPNSNNWYSSDVTIKFTASDSLSGIDTVTPNTVISQEGDNQSISGVAIDKAGNKMAIEVGGINIDKTSPVITGAATASPNNNGWYNTDVTVHYSATDKLSGVDMVSPDSVVETEGASQSAIGTAIDKAGNSADYTVSGINIDKTAPVTNAALSGKSSSDCYSGDVGVVLTAHDNLSGIASILYNLDNNGWFSYISKVLVSGDGVHSLRYDSMDKADNTENENSISFTVDKVPPEAVMKFDPQSGDIKVYNSKNGNEVEYTVTSKNISDDEDKGWDLRRYTLKGCANNLVMTLKHKKEGKEAKVKVVSLQYGSGTKIKLDNSSLKVEYSKGSDGNYKQVEQKIEAKKLFDVESKYDARRNTTEIKIKSGDQGEKRETKQGMSILELITSKGSLKYGY